MIADMTENEATALSGIKSNGKALTVQLDLLTVSAPNWQMEGFWRITDKC